MSRVVNQQLRDRRSPVSSRRELKRHTGRRSARSVLERLAPGRPLRLRDQLLGVDPQQAVQLTPGETRQGGVGIGDLALAGQLGDGIG